MSPSNSVGKMAAVETSSSPTGDSREQQPVSSIVAMHLDERGEQALEVLMFLAFGILPMIGAVLLMQDVVQEYVAFGQIFITSPFF